MLRVLVLGFVMSITGANAALAAGNEPPTHTAVLDCQAPISRVSSPPDYVTSFGSAVALQTRASNRRAIQTALDQDSAIPQLQYFAKSPLFVRIGGRSAQVRIPKQEVGHVAVTWGNTDHDGIATRRFTVGPCSGTARWIGFPGGFFVDRPACIALIVRVSGRNHRVHMGVGAPCAGQRPAGQPK